MKQRVPRRAWYSGRSLDRPRVLVESASPALAVSDFSVFQDAGFDVGVCSGPGGTPEDCPLLRGEECALLEGADAVLHKLDQPLDIAAAIHRQRPDIPVLVEVRRGADGSMPAVPAGCVPLPYPCSVRAKWTHCASTPPAGAGKRRLAYRAEPLAVKSVAGNWCDWLA